jgi:hypothetical protein
VAPLESPFKILTDYQFEDGDEAVRRYRLVDLKPR